jgi:hypothetical protein
VSGRSTKPRASGSLDLLVSPKSTGFSAASYITKASVVRSCLEGSAWCLQSLPRPSRLFLICPDSPPCHDLDSAARWDAACETGRRTSVEIHWRLLGNNDCFTQGCTGILDAKIVRARHAFICGRSLISDQRDGSVPVPTWPQRNERF